MKIAFIIISYNTSVRELVRLKREIELLDFADYEILTVDNTDNNIGYAAGVNQGIRKGLEINADIFVILNPDISLKSLSRERILESLKHFDVWGYAMIQDNKAYYGGQIDRMRMSGGLADVKPINRFSKSDFVSGSFMWIKKEVIVKIGYFNESYFMYYEDVDYCYRAGQSGFRVGIDSSQSYIHFELSKNSLDKELYLLKNRIKFLVKYGSFKQKLYEFLRLPRTLVEEFFHSSLDNKDNQDIMSVGLNGNTRIEKN